MRKPEKISRYPDEIMKAIHDRYIHLWQYKEIISEIYVRNHANGLFHSAGKSSWRIVGISTGALKQFEDEEFASGIKGLQRDHIFARKETLDLLVNREAPLPFEEFKKITWRRDPTILVTKKEHSDIKRSKEYLAYPLCWRKGYFFDRKFRKSIEGEFLANGGHLNISDRPWTLDEFRKWKGIM